MCTEYLVQRFLSWCLASSARFWSDNWQIKTLVALIVRSRRLQADGLIRPQECTNVMHCSFFPLQIKHWSLLSKIAFRWTSLWQINSWEQLHVRWRLGGDTNLVSNIAKVNNVKSPGRRHVYFMVIYDVIAWSEVSIWINVSLEPTIFIWQVNYKQ